MQVDLKSSNVIHSATYNEIIFRLIASPVDTHRLYTISNANIYPFSLGNSRKKKKLCTRRVLFFSRRFQFYALLFFSAYRFLFDSLEMFTKNNQLINGWDPLQLLSCCVYVFFVVSLPLCKRHNHQILDKIDFQP